MPIKDLVTPTTYAKDLPRWQQLIAKKIRLYRSHTMLRHADGHIIPTIATQTLVTHADGTPKYVYSVTAPNNDADTLDHQHSGHELPHLDDEHLTREEQTILVTLAASGTLSDVEKHLHLTRACVQHHLTKLRHRLRLPADTRTGGLVARAYAHGILQPGTWPPRIS
jgi:DNA-binding NarL/FixJ family response regulator